MLHLPSVGDIAALFYNRGPDMYFRGSARDLAHVTTPMDSAACWVKESTGRGEESAVGFHGQPTEPLGDHASGDIADQRELEDVSTTLVMVLAMIDLLPMDSSALLVLLVVLPKTPTCVRLRHEDRWEYLAVVHGHQMAAWQREPAASIGLVLIHGRESLAQVWLVLIHGG